MILGVNGIRLIGRRSGVGRCIEAVLRCMDEVAHPFREIRVYTPEPLGEDVALPACATNVVLPSSLPPGWWEQFVLPRAHGSRHPLLCPSYVVPLPARCPLVLIHHGSYEGYPSAFGWWTRNRARAIFTLSARRATMLSTVSEHSKRDIVRFYRVRPERVHVIPEGVDTTRFRPIAQPERLSQWRVERFGENVPFVLYVGKPARRRNLPALLRAFAQLKRDRNIPHKLLLVGTDLPGSSFQPIIKELGLQNDVFTIGFLDHDAMPTVYNAAEMLVYPSSYEGFGMPVLEAMACGTPAIALNNSAFPEFADGVALLLEDAQVTTLAAGMEAVLTDRDWRARVSVAGPERAAAYDWRQITRRYVGLMSRCAAA
jgi:glycosyltransferase involved in cell wall biosynthesis